MYRLEDVEIINMGGHSDCSSVVYIPEEKALFAGDLVFAGRFPWAGDPTSHPETWIKAFQRILDMDVETIIPGHGPICDKVEIRTQMNWFKNARDILSELISRGEPVKEAVKPEHYPEFYDYSGGRLERSLRHWYNVLS
jgi:glyoxylase-like metal-dependent hydrolase (beta-lactamase superfamily II)